MSGKFTQRVERFAAVSAAQAACRQLARSVQAWMDEDARLSLSVVEALLCLIRAAERAEADLNCARSIRTTDRATLLDASTMLMGATMLAWSAISREDDDVPQWLTDRAHEAKRAVDGFLWPGRIEIEEAA